jgi:hypothetical protein
MWRALIVVSLCAALAHAQEWPLGDGKLKLSFESRVRYEDRSGNAFGREPDIETALVRTRVGATYTSGKWLKLSATVQDGRAPWYRANAPNTVRDNADLHEGYFELLPGSRRGFGMTVGRRMLNYGETRLIASPEWAPLARTYDQARLYYNLPKAHLEFLFISPVKIRITEFNRPVLGERVWGTYNTFRNIRGDHLLEAYILRHDQNRPGGFTGGDRAAETDRLGVNTFGVWAAGPFVLGTKYSTEVALQTGKVGPARHRAAAAFVGLSRRTMLAGRTLDISGEYKYASGTDNPQDTARTGTFDQLFPANHDKFGHQDLFGWRNMHGVRSTAVLAVTRKLAVNLMYTSHWLASRRDALYNAAGRPIVRSVDGTAGRHVGQEVDVFATYKHEHLVLGAGYAHFFSGRFIRRTTPAVGPTYLYVFYTFSF